MLSITKGEVIRSTVRKKSTKNMEAAGRNHDNSYKSYEKVC